MTRYFEINHGGHNIRCKLYFRDIHTVRRVVVFCHGFGGHKDNGAAEKLADRLLSKYKNAALMTFNWPVHGDDVKKKLCLADCDAYLAAVIDDLRERFDDPALFCCATSFGGYLTLKYLADHGNPFQKVALRCPAMNMYEVLCGTIMAQGELEKLHKGKEIAVGFDRKIPVTPAFVRELQEYDIRTLDFLDYAEEIRILHGTADEIVPFAESQTFAENNLIEFFPIQGADHRFRNPRDMDTAIKLILEWFAL